MKTVTTRIPEEDEADLASLEEEMMVDRAAVLRQLIARGLDEWKTERALDELREGRITLRTAAERAEKPYVEMLELAAEEGIDVGYSTEDLERDLGRI